MPLHAKVHDPFVEPQLHIELAILLRRPQPQPSARHRAQQVSLGEVRALIWWLGFRAQQHYPAGEPGVPESGGNCIASRTAANDQRLWLRFSNSRKRRSDQARYPPSTRTANAYAQTR